MRKEHSRTHLKDIRERAFQAVCLVTQLCLTLCDPKDCSPPDSSVHGDSPGKSTGLGCHALLQGIFLTQGLNLHLLHCRQILYPLSHLGSQNYFFRCQYIFTSKTLKWRKCHLLCALDRVTKITNFNSSSSEYK